MFGLLKNKLSGFVNKLIKREESKETPTPKAEEKIIETPKPAPEPKAAPKSEPAPVQVEAPKPAPSPKPEPKTALAPKVETAKPAPSPAPKPVEISKPQPKPVEEKKEKPRLVEVQKPKTTETPKQKTAEPVVEKPKPVEEKKGILSSIWPFSKKEEPAAAKKEAEMPVPKAQTPATSAPTISTSKPAASKTAEKTEISSAPASPVSSALASPASSASPSLDDANLSRLEKKSLSDEEREMKVKMGLGKSVVGFFTPSVTVEENDVRDLLDDLELSLLESDVAMEVSTEVTQRLRTRLVGMKAPKNQVQEKVQEQMQAVLTEVMTSSSAFDFIARVKSVPKPAKILFVGPNGAGKTTTMAKLAHRFAENGMSVVLSASDTFRAAAIEQTEVHAKRLGVPVIKSAYGADPASVAFDAVRYAQAHKIDVVLIDSAGRQDTNTNLLDELKKINRVVKPDIKIYIGESIGGHALMDQIRTFHETIGIDGAILTKLDCDAKGGTAISLTHATGVPILFLGTGQRYEDLVPFDAAKVAQQILT